MQTALTENPYVLNSMIPALMFVWGREFLFALKSVFRQVLRFVRNIIKSHGEILKRQKEPEAQVDQKSLTCIRLIMC